MATFSATTVVIAASAGPLQPQAKLRVNRSETFRCAYSKEGLKACAAMDLSPAVLKGLGLRRVWRPWGSELVEDDIDTEGRRFRPLSREWVLACVLGYIFFNPRREAPRFQQ